MAHTANADSDSEEVGQLVRQSFVHLGPSHKQFIVCFALVPRGATRENTHGPIDSRAWSAWLFHSFPAPGNGESFGGTVQDFALELFRGATVLYTNSLIVANDLHQPCNGVTPCSEAIDVLEAAVFRHTLWQGIQRPEHHPAWAYCSRGRTAEGC